MERLRAEWAKRLKDRRAELGMTQLELAEAAGITQVRLSAYELGLNVPRDEVRIALAKALRCQVADLFTYPDVLDILVGVEEDETNGGTAA